MTRRDRMTDKQYIEELQAALLENTTALVDAAQGLPVVALTHRISAAESLLEGTEYPFRTNWR
ncbi:MAG: hypothetical protein ABIR91_02800 [Candidatus Saccharimonadales bacterium]